MKRRALLFKMANVGLILVALRTTSSVAQRPARPIRPRPPPGWADRPLLPGRFSPEVAAAPAPGVFTVTAVRPRDNLMQLRDRNGRTADIYVDSDVYDLSALEPGDTVAVDFFVPNPGDERIEAASVWKVEVDRP